MAAKNAKYGHEHNGNCISRTSHDLGTIDFLENHHDKQGT
jgi:hypothetical protein